MMEYWHANFQNIKKMARTEHGKLIQERRIERLCGVKGVGYVLLDSCRDRRARHGWLSINSRSMCGIGATKKPLHRYPLGQVWRSRKRNGNTEGLKSHKRSISTPTTTLANTFMCFGYFSLCLRVSTSPQNVRVQFLRRQRSKAQKTTNRVDDHASFLAFSKTIPLTQPTHDASSLSTTSAFTPPTSPHWSY